MKDRLSPVQTETLTVRVNVLDDLEPTVIAENDCLENDASDVESRSHELTTSKTARSSVSTNGSFSQHLAADDETERSHSFLESPEIVVNTDAEPGPRGSGEVTSSLTSAADDGSSRWSSSLSQQESNPGGPRRSEQHSLVTSCSGETASPVEPPAPSDTQDAPPNTPVELYFSQPRPPCHDFLTSGLDGDRKCPQTDDVTGRHHHVDKSVREFEETDVKALWKVLRGEKGASLVVRGGKSKEGKKEKGGKRGGNKDLEQINGMERMLSCIKYVSSVSVDRTDPIYRHLDASATHHHYCFTFLLSKEKFQA
ncbi:uncharacterized protein LOC101856365 [Aplysia californica]|uniref:Uncharacterized protein LOC101856365 n=1 Tax=Aplysia californica TaxID=6500 RepID=A0ABM0JXV7_APLCA|nr:uncharacterized protein LOC101856365 [Aplysia californica]